MAAMQKIILVSIVKNEGDVIESFVRHSLTYADELIIADHQSTDGTWEILQKLRAEGLPLTLERLYRVEHAQREEMNRLVREAIVEHGAAIVLPFDADEFLVSDVQSISCRQVLQALPPNTLYRLRWRIFEPALPEQDREQFLLLRPCRRERDFSTGFKTMVGGYGYTHGRPYELVQGQHFGVYLDDSSSVPWTEVPHLYLAHYRWRSPDQYALKAATGWLGNVAKYTRHTLSGTHWKVFFDKLRQGEAAEAQDILQDSEPFDLRPFVVSQTLRYTTARPAPLLSSLMVAAEQVAEQLAETKVLTQHKKVSIICVWTGEDAAGWQRSWRSALKQLYPWREFIVLCLTPTLPEDIAAQVQQAGQREQVSLVQAGENGWAEALAARVQGDFCQWLLPGEEIHPDKVQRMVACILMQETPIATLFAGGREELGTQWQPGLWLAPTDPLLAYHARDVWENLLMRGRYPIGGLSAGLYARELMVACHWLEPCFLGRSPMVFVMWRTILQALAKQECGSDIVGIMQADLCDVPLQVTPQAFLWQQLQWASLLQDSADQELADRGWQAFAALGVAVRPQAQLLASSPLAPEYQRFLQARGV